MRIPQGLGFDLTCGINLAVVLANGNVLQGTLLGVVGDRNIGYYPPIPPNQHFYFHKQSPYQSVIKLYADCPIHQRFV